MALLFCDGMDAYGGIGDFLRKWAATPSTVSSSFNGSGGKFNTAYVNWLAGGGGSAGMTSGNIGLSVSNTLNFGYWYNTNTVPTTGATWNGNGVGSGLMLPSSLSGTQCVLAAGTAGTLNAMKLANSTTILATGSKNLSDGNWHWVEVSILFSTSSGVFTVKIDGVTDINFSGVTMTAGATLNGSFGLYNTSNNGAGTNSAAYDDVIVWDSTGSAYNTYPLGAKRIGTVNPNGAGASTQFTPSTGSNWSCTSQAYSGSAFVSDAATGNTDLYTTGGLGFTPPTNGTIGPFVVNHYSVNPSGDGTKNLAGKLRSGSTPATATGTSRNLTAIATTYQDAYYVDGASAAWTTANVNSAQIGIGD